jgi:hypothetical protein
LPAVELRFVAAALLLVGCSHAAGGSSASSSSISASIPEEFRPEIERATRIGREIFAQDQASARAADVWLARVPEERRRLGHGWVTLGGPPWKVAFLEGPSDAERVAFEVASGILTAVEPPRPLEADEALRRRMVRSAGAAVKASCGTPMNPVVLGPEGNDGWRVYFLNSPGRPGERVLGGHLRVRVSDGGLAVLGVERMSQCLVQGQASVGAGTAALVLGTPLLDAPNEGHVFTAMSNGLPLHLGTYKTPPGRVWLIREDGTVTFDRMLPPH